MFVEVSWDCCDAFTVAFDWVLVELALAESALTKSVKSAADADFVSST